MAFKVLHKKALLHADSKANVFTLYLGGNTLRIFLTVHPPAVYGLLYSVLIFATSPVSWH